ncbi:hypothetical protein EI94DRAFT_1735538 [Lactarius quietus]|nr:hypothetical protein EI94DRAFT_1735538 [Lactarius quietus]
MVSQRQRQMHVPFSLSFPSTFSKQSTGASGLSFYQSLSASPSYLSLRHSDGGNFTVWPTSSNSTSAGTALRC